MDSHIKERLVGAAVLVALGVWLIPWLLDGQDGADRADQEPESAAAGLNLPAPDEAGSSPSEATQIDSGGSESTAEVSDFELSSPDIAAPASAAPERPATAASVAPDVGDVASNSTAGIAPGSDSPVELTPKAASPTAAWVVQLGSFREPVNARELAVQVAGYGYEASVGEIQIAGVLWHRVRVEGFATRDQAESARSSLSAHDLDAQVLRGE